MNEGTISTNSQSYHNTLLIRIRTQKPFFPQHAAHQCWMQFTSGAGSLPKVVALQSTSSFYFWRALVWQKKSEYWFDCLDHNMIILLQQTGALNHHFCWSFARQHCFNSTTDLHLSAKQQCQNLFSQHSNKFYVLSNLPSDPSINLKSLGILEIRTRAKRRTLFLYLVWWMSVIYKNYFCHHYHQTGLPQKLCRLLLLTLNHLAKILHSGWSRLWLSRTTQE